MIAIMVVSWLTASIRRTRSGIFSGAAFIAVLAATLVAGCGPNRLYVGPPRPLNEIAVVEGSSAVDEERTVVSIDAYELPFFRGQTYELEPGRHKIAITTADGFWVVKRMVEPCDVDFVAEAGHRYTIIARDFRTAVVVHLLDTVTGEEIKCVARRPAYFE